MNPAKNIILTGNWKSSKAVRPFSAPGTRSRIRSMISTRYQSRTYLSSILLVRSSLVIYTQAKIARIATKICNSRVMRSSLVCRHGRHQAGQRHLNHVVDGFLHGDGRLTGFACSHLNRDLLDLITSLQNCDCCLRLRIIPRIVLREEFDNLAVCKTHSAGRVCHHFPGQSLDPPGEEANSHSTKSR